ncbi:MAG: DNA-3-methyladenine glycosylase I [Armatimonadetes bacterium]|nr:DNA-3-methyladenine glycosylase I [Armatimonadota bacterium]
MKRCSWAESEAMQKYHDEEWGVPSRDDRHLFEMLILEGAQAGLSWSTILNRREGYRRAYHDFDPSQVAQFTSKDQERLLTDPGIVRNRAKVAASVKNARAFLEVQREHGSFATYLWAFVDGRPLQNHWTAMGQVPAVTDLATAISKDLQKRGFGFVGPTIIYAFMQAVGLVNDHLAECFRYEECKKFGAKVP